HEIHHGLVVLEGSKRARQFEIASRGREQMPTPRKMVVGFNLNSLGEPVLAGQIADIAPLVQIECSTVLRDTRPEGSNQNIALRPHIRVPGVPTCTHIMSPYEAIVGRNVNTAVNVAIGARTIGSMSAVTPRAGRPGKCIRCVCATRARCFASISVPDHAVMRTVASIATAPGRCHACVSVTMSVATNTCGGSCPSRHVPGTMTPTVASGKPSARRPPRSPCPWPPTHVAGPVPDDMSPEPCHRPWRLGSPPRDAPSGNRPLLHRCRGNQESRLDTSKPADPAARVRSPYRACRIAAAGC